jgi:nucleotide-binding universal stress UspA family protein
LTLIHVPHAETAAYVLDAMSEYHAAVSVPTFEEIEAAGQKILDEGLEIAENTGCNAVKTHMPHGDAATEIIAFAEEINADLIITGRRGLSRFSSLVLGSTTQRISRMAKCACLSVV